MGTLAHVGTAAALLALAGCAQMKTMSNPAPCPVGTDAICVVTVTVRDCDTISAQPDRAMVTVFGKKGDVQWVLDAPAGWDFAKDGIKFKKPGHPQFGNDRPGKKSFRWTFDNSQKDEHPYTIYVTDGYKTCSRDPSIMN
jgi:hypothetical protein